MTEYIIIIIWHEGKKVDMHNEYDTFKVLSGIIWSNYCPAYIQMDAGLKASVWQNFLGIIKIHLDD